MVRRSIGEELDDVLTASVTCLRIASAMGFCVRFVSLSKHVDMSSMQIHTSASVMKHPKHWTMYGQSCDFKTTSRSIVIRFVSSSLPVLRICLTAMIAPLGLCFILTTCPLVPLPSSLKYSRSLTFVSYRMPLIFSEPVLSSRSLFSVSTFRRGCRDGIGSAGVGRLRLFGVKFNSTENKIEFSIIWWKRRSAPHFDFLL